MMSLIETLNRLGHLTPDQIVSQINDNGWTHGLQVTEEQLTSGRLLVVVAWSDTHRWMIINDYWNPTNYFRRNGLDGTRDHLRKYWIKSYDDYNSDPESRPSRPLVP